MKKPFLMWTVMETEYKAERSEGFADDYKDGYERGQSAAHEKFDSAREPCPPEQPQQLLKPVGQYDHPESDPRNERAYIVACTEYRTQHDAPP